MISLNIKYINVFIYYILFYIKIIFIINTTKLLVNWTKIKKIILIFFLFIIPILFLEY